MPPLHPDLPARLLRSRASRPSQLATAAMEEIAAGRLAAMIRLVLSDPDAQFWPYRIEVAGISIDGDAAIAIDRQLGAQGPLQRS